MSSVFLGPSHNAAAFSVRNKLALLVIVAGLGVLMVRLVLVQVVRGPQYERFAAVERVSKVRAIAPRGVIIGNRGEVMARNIESHRLEILLRRVRPERAVPIADTIRTVLDVTDSEYNGLIAELRHPHRPRRNAPLVVRHGLVSNHCPYDSHALEMSGEVPYSFCSTCGRRYEQPPRRHLCPVDRRRLHPSGNGDGLHCTICGREFLDKETCPYDDTPVQRAMHILRCPICGRTYNDEVALLRSQLHLLPEARVRAEIQREYPYRYLASHLLGYMARVNQRDLRPFVAGGPARFSLNDRTGRTGLERSLDTLLRGVDGDQVLVRRRGTEEDASDLRELIEVMQPKPTLPGLSVHLTLDLELQRTAKVAMSHVRSGAAVVLDARTGKVLVLYSKPSFDPNVWSGRLTAELKARIDSNHYAPMLNKAVRAFSPASTYKVVTTVAALEQGLITPETKHHCPGHYEFGGRRFRCYNRDGHGNLDLLSALQKSCDVYFYKVGEKLGIDRLHRYGREMGFGESTGIEIHESVGRVPSRAYYSDRNIRYFPGFALSTAVGQKDVTATPLQLARVFAGIASGGQLPSVTLLDSLQRAGKRVEVMGRRPGRRVELKPQTLATLRDGLTRVVEREGGTAYRHRLAGVRVAGKTGTAEAAERGKKGLPKAVKRWLKEDHAWFAAFAPAAQARIVTVVFVEHGGGGGAVAAPIAKRIMAAWFKAHPDAMTTAKVADPRPGLDAPSQVSATDSSRRYGPFLELDARVETGHQQNAHRTGRGAP
jgi:penicillin-binding protein 2